MSSYEDRPQVFLCLGVKILVKSLTAFSYPQKGLSECEFLKAE